MGQIVIVCGDDSDGASEGDDDYSVYGKTESEEEDENQTMPLINGAPPRKPNIPDDFQIAEMSALNVAVGQRYENKEALETRLKILSVIHHFDFDVDKSTPVLYTVKCWVKHCSWRLRASPIGDSRNFYVRIFVREHTCSATERSELSRQATYEILGQLYKNFVGAVGPSVLPSHVSDALQKRYHLKVDYWKVHHALRYARELIRGTPESGYVELPTYLYQIRRTNPGSYTRLVVDDINRFKFLFIAFGASIIGFQYMRKVVVVDDTHLQGKYKGTLLLAIAQDGNFGIFPIAFGVVDTENDESWDWFFKQLSIVIPDDRGLAIISDRHRAIGNAIGEVYPLATRGICTYHLYKNILQRFRGGESSRLVKKAANAYRMNEYNYFFEEISH